MNLPPATVLLIILIAAVANILILAAVTARVRASRAQRLVEVQGFMSSSYGHDRPDTDTDPVVPADAWLPSDESWSRSRHVWTEANGWMTPNWEAERSRSADIDPSEAPFEYPEPTTLEQRAAMVDPPPAAWTEMEAEWDAGLESDDDQAAGAAAIDETDPESDAAEADASADTDDSDDDTEEVDMIQDEDTIEAEATDATDDTDVADVPTAATIATNGASGHAPSARLGTPRGRDALTGMLDGPAFEEVMAQEEAREQRYGRPATVIVFELDGLTKLVDRLGPEPGDRIETALGDTIKRLARRADHVARLERGRYAVLLPETDEVAAINYVERIRRAADLWLESGAIAMRLAIGWASAAGDAGLSGAVRVATDRMRLEQRRQARGAGDVAPEADALDGLETAEAGSGL
jgi:diguanylate cyclase (GGDEF)-like protein